MKPDLYIKWLLIITLIVGCKGRNGNSNESSNHDMVIGVSMLSLQNEFVVNLRDALDKAAEEKHIRLIVTDAQRSAE